MARSVRAVVLLPAMMAAALGGFSQGCPRRWPPRHRAARGGHWSSGRPGRTSRRHRPAVGGLLLDGKRPPRADQSVVDADGAVLETVSSGNYSPMLDPGIALAFLAPDIEPGTRVAVDIRGRPEPAEVVTPPFVTS